MRIAKGKYIAEASFDTGPYAGVVKSSREVDLSGLTEPVKAVGAAKLQPTGVSGFASVDLSPLFNRQHNSVQVGGGDNASFKTWFTKDEVSSDGVPFLVRREGKDVLVSENNTQNVWELEGLGAAARSLHFLIWGYNYPGAPAQVCIVHEDGTQQLCEFPLSEWTQGNPPVAFDFQNTVSNFQHAAVNHRSIKLASPGKKIAKIISSSGVYGLIAITLDQGHE